MNSGPIHISLENVLRERLGKKAHWIPRPLIRSIERLICQQQMNDMLSYAYPSQGAQFCREVISRLNIDININGIENMPDKGNPRVLFCSNHPLGGLDGMILIQFIENYFNAEPLFIINDLLMAIEPLRSVFVPVNKHGAQSRASIKAIDNAFESDRPVIIFPAGLCSRRIDGIVKDLPWQKTFIQKAIQHHRDIFPLRFNAQNSPSFYRWAKLRERLGIKFNAEMILLPGEVFKSEGKTFNISVGKRIPWESLSTDFKLETQKIRNIVDSMASKA